MKKILSLSILLFTILIFSQQTPAQELTWNEVKAQQNAERLSMETMQKEAMENLKELQKLELAKAFAGDFQELTVKQKGERTEMNKQFSEERTKLAQIHADERKAFLANQKPKP